MKRSKPLTCRKCGHRLGTVRVKPVFRKKMLWYGIGIAFVFEFIANFIIKLIGL